jgi:hypothetical protein
MIKPPDRDPVVVASHPRSGTHLLLDLLRRQFPACRSWKWPGERLDRLYCNIDELAGRDGILDERTAHRILSRTERPLVKTHAFPGFRTGFLDRHTGEIDASWLEWIQDRATLLYVYRDGRDVLCSYQLFRQSFDPQAQTTIGKFLRQNDNGHNRVRRWADHVRSWMNQPEAEAIRFEAVLTDPAAVLHRLGEILDQDPEMQEPLLPEPFDSIWESRWARLTGVRPESTAIINGASKDWETSFTPDDRSFFHDQAGDLLLELGYESSPEWTKVSSENPA